MGPSLIYEIYLLLAAVMIHVWELSLERAPVSSEMLGFVLELIRITFHYHV
jgi:hypothetical protein